LWRYEDLLPYFRKSENDLDRDGEYHGKGGPIAVYHCRPETWHAPARAFADACLAAGYRAFADANSPDSNGVGPCPYNNPGKIRISTALGYLAPARGRPNLAILPDALVHRVLFDGTRATGVEVEVGGQLRSIEGDEVIVSSGAMGSPQVLLRSGVGPAEDLLAAGIPVVLDLPGVGANLMDHTAITIAFRVRPELMPGPDDPYGQVFLRYTSSARGLAERPMSEVSRVDTDMFIRLVQVEDQMHFFTGTYAPVSTGQVRVVSGDPHVDPVIDFRYLSDPFDLRRMCDTVRLSLRLAEHPSFSDIIVERLTPGQADIATDEALRAWVLRWVDSAKHVTSSCRMGPAENPLAVVDQFGRVHGTSGLRVVDASIMPRPTRGNTNATTIAIGERVADLIRTGAQSQQIAASAGDFSHRGP
jgi:choline dehydrogenase